MTTTHRNGTGPAARSAHRSAGTWMAAVTTAMLGLMATAALLLPSGSTGARCPTVSAQLIAAGSTAAQSVGCDGADGAATADDATVLPAAADDTASSLTPTGTTTPADVP